MVCLHEDVVVIKVAPITSGWRCSVVIIERKDIAAV